MSWSVNASGKAKDVAPAIAEQISHIKLNDEGEMETVARVGGLISQTLSTFDEEKPVKVGASGHMGFANWTDKTGPFQNVSITIEPIHFTV